MTRCNFCGNDNGDSEKFCAACGKPLVQGGAKVIPVPAAAAAGRAAPVGAGGAAMPTSGSESRSSAAVPAGRLSEAPKTGKGGGAGLKTACRYCGSPIDPAMPFCPKCGGRAGDGTPASAVQACPQCDNKVTPGVDVFCARCGARVSAEPPSAPMPAAVASGTGVFSAASAGQQGPTIAMLDASGNVARTISLVGPEATIGRADGEIRFSDDVFLSPIHASLAWRDGQVFVRDLGSRNGTWLYALEPYKLQDGDTVLVGSQLIRFRRLGYPGPNPPEADATRRLGSATPSADVAVLQQLRADGSARDTCHLSPARSVVIGREQGDWLFPYDRTMSGRHAEVRSEDLEFIVIDLGSRNGIAVAVRGEKSVKVGQRILMGDQTLRLESL